MPLYEFECTQCGATHDRICSFAECETAADQFECSCGGAIKKLLSIPAFTPERWGDGTGKYGVNGFKCVQSGRRFQNKREQYKWMEANGKVCVNGTQYDTLSYHESQMSDLNKQDKQAAETANYINQNRHLVRKK
jgi:putative FmdB family regulatory protein